mmetsp:Transcript_2593/g.5733  ORF Transcript_2593/g.5733 Transcript_2593/m.5733 type:complete len:224 (-) Transcript_2593:1339-2010(-)
MAAATSSAAAPSLAARTSRAASLSGLTPSETPAPWSSSSPAGPAAGAPISASGAAAGLAAAFLYSDPRTAPAFLAGYASAYSRSRCRALVWLSVPMGGMLSMIWSRVRRGTFLTTSPVASVTRTSSSADPTEWSSAPSVPDDAAPDDPRPARRVMALSSRLFHLFTTFMLIMDRPSRNCTDCPETSSTGRRRYRYDPFEEPASVNRNCPFLNRIVACRADTVR